MLIDAIIGYRSGLVRKYTLGKYSGEHSNHGANEILPLWRLYAQGYVFWDESTR